MWLLCLAAVKPSKLPTLDAVTVAKHLWETSDLFATDVHGMAFGAARKACHRASA